MSKTARMIVFGDPHCPFERRESVDWLCSEIRKHRKGLTHVINLGDTFEADAASRWGNENNHDLLDEYAAGASFLDRVRLSGGDSPSYIWLLGNHDDNIQAEQRLDKRIRRLAHWNYSQHRESFTSWRQIPYGKSRETCLEIGQVILKHGVTTNDSIECIEWANICGGHAHRLVIGGHTHRPTNLSRRMRTTKVPDQIWYANPGTIGPLNPSWTKRMNTQYWAPGYIYVEAEMGRACMPEVKWDMRLVTPHDWRR